jgi:hypothetical protein
VVGEKRSADVVIENMIKLLGWHLVFEPGGIYKPQILEHR